MRCDQFDARLQNLLDARTSPEQDLPLQRHAQQCPCCQAQLTSLSRLLDGLDLLDVPALPDDFAQHVIQQVNGPRPRSTPSLGTLVAVALAATLVMAVVPMAWYLSRRSQPWAQSPPSAAAPHDELAQAVPTPQTLDQTAEAEEGWLVPGASILELYPAEVRQRHREQVNQIADDLRPIATPFNAAMTAIRRSMPMRQAPTKGAPRTSLQHARSAQHLS